MSEDLKQILDKLATLACDDPDVQEAFDNLVYDHFGLGQRASAINNSGGEEQLATFRAAKHTDEEILRGLVNNFGGTRDQLIELTKE